MCFSYFTYCNNVHVCCQNSQCNKVSGLVIRYKKVITIQKIRLDPMILDYSRMLTSINRIFKNNSLKAFKVMIKPEKVYTSPAVSFHLHIIYIHKYMYTIFVFVLTMDLSLKGRLSLRVDS